MYACKRIYLSLLTHSPPGREDDPRGIPARSARAPSSHPPAPSAPSQILTVNFFLPTVKPRRRRKKKGP